MKKRKICVVVASRANYGRVKSVLMAIEKDTRLELQLIVGASTLLYRFGKAVEIILKDGFKPVRKIYYVLEGETLATQAKSTGYGIVELSTAFEDLQPDMVITVADRFETMATAVAAAYLNITLVHIQGGEVTGNIDERVRHAITKLSDIHFVATEKARERIIKMGENPDRIFNYGCPAMDLLANENLSISNDIMKSYGGTGKTIDWSEPYILIVQHPVTTSYGQGFKQISQTLEALGKFKNIKKVVLWPNVDAGTDDVSKGIRVFREANKEEDFHYFRGFSPEHYAAVLNNAVCCVGNSSSFIREGAFLGTPVVIIGDRQQGRECGKNVVFANYDSNEIANAVANQLKHGRYSPNKLFGDGNAGQRIVEKIATIKIDNNKILTY
ncbi:MAG: UDP-N-acetylglucosamine 2-epimerase [Phycisphaerae bacterium]|jgi:UDP-N-acetylglucosamine 2-epimerase